MRALTEAEKAQRRDALAQVAAELFQSVGYTGLTVEAVAKAAGVAKGSVFLAFASKEDLVLHAASQRFDGLFRHLESLDPRVPPGTLARNLADGLRDDPVLMPLLALVGPVLEQGCSPEAVVRFKEGLAAHLVRVAAAWARLRPEVPVAAWPPLFLRLHAVILGAWAAGEASQVVREALADRPDLGFLLTRFEDLLVPLLEAQLAAFTGTSVVLPMEEPGARG